MVAHGHPLIYASSVSLEQQIYICDLASRKKAILALPIPFLFCLRRRSIKPQNCKQNDNSVTAGIIAKLIYRSVPTMRLPTMLAPLLSLISASLTFALSLPLVNSLAHGNLTLPQRLEAYETRCVRIEDRNEHTLSEFPSFPTSPNTIQNNSR